MKEYFKIAFRNLKVRKLRSYLTILGISIGVFLIISLLSLGQGLKETVMKELKMMGKEILMVFPGDLTDMITLFLGRIEIKNEEIKAIKRVEGVEIVVPLDYKAEMVRYQGKTKMVLLFAYPRKEAQELFKSDLGWKLIDGQWPKAEKREVIVGRLVPKEIFPDLKVGDKIFIKGKEFLVTGILQSLGSKQDDSMIGVDLPFYHQITGKKEGSQFAFVKIKSGIDGEIMAERIKKELESVQKRKKGEEKNQYSVLTNEKANSIAGGIILLVQVIVFAFASIAIFAGGIGIANTMFTSVRERTREIGIMKAIGAKNSEILFIFLIESSILGLVGGLIGTFLGLIFAKMVEFYGQVHPLFYFKASITPHLIIFGFLFSILVGVVAGYLPAKKAAFLKPAEALRYFE